MATKSASVFAPPRNKPKISLPQPSLAAGQPMPQIQTINRPVNLVDDEGNVHGRIGENPNGPERVQITPPPGPTNDPAGGPTYASGGTLLIGGGSQQSPGSISPPGVDPNIHPSQPQQQPQTQPPVRPSITSFNGGPSGALYNAQNNQIAARNNSLDLRAKVLDLKGANQPLQQAVYDAKGNLIQAQQQQTQAQTGYYQQQQQNEQARQQELEGISAASQNAPDLINAANAQDAYNSENRRDSQMGVAAPAEINLPPGYNGPRQAGIRPKIMTQEQRLNEKAGYEDPIRNNKLQIAQTIVSLQGQDVRRAELLASQAGLSLDEANQLVNQAQLQEDYSSIASSRTDLEAQQANIPPEPGMIKTKPEWGVGDKWVTTQEADQLQTQYQQNVQGPYSESLQNQGSNLAGVDVPKLLNSLPNNATFLQQHDVVTELIRRYQRAPYNLTLEQAVQKAYQDVQQELSGTKRTGGGVLVLPGQNGQPVNPSGTSAAQGNPAAAPTGTSSASGGPSSGGRYSEYTVN